MVGTGINQQVVMEIRALSGVTVICVTKNSLSIRHLEMNLEKKIPKKTRETGLPRCLAQAQ